MTNTTFKKPMSHIPHSFWIAIGLNMVWINLSEVFRYFAFVMPMMRDAFPMLHGVAPMNIPVFLIWGVWDTILVVSVCSIAWLSLDKFGSTMRHVVQSATGIWAMIFVILWLGLLNMNLATTSIVLVALPLAWFEIFVATLIVRWAMSLQLRTKLSP